MKRFGNDRAKLDEEAQKPADFVNADGLDVPVYTSSEVW